MAGHALSERRMRAKSYLVVPVPPDAEHARQLVVHGEQMNPCLDLLSDPRREAYTAG